MFDDKSTTIRIYAKKISLSFSSRINNERTTACLIKVRIECHLYSLVFLAAILAALKLRNAKRNHMLVLKCEYRK